LEQARLLALATAAVGGHHKMEQEAVEAEVVDPVW
jgi:hypothetical protein